MFHSDPGEKCEAEGKVEEAFVGYCEDDKGRGKGEEDGDETVKVVAVWSQAV